MRTTLVREEVEHDERGFSHFKGHIYTAVGLGATISQATDNGNFDLLLAATILMAATAVTINRLVFRRLYALAETDGIVCHM